MNGGDFWARGGFIIGCMTSYNFDFATIKLLIFFFIGKNKIIFA